MQQILGGLSVVFFPVFEDAQGFAPEVAHVQDSPEITHSNMFTRRRW